MKKILYIFLATLLIFASCSDDATTPITNQFSGNWIGTYSGSSSGFWTATILTNGEVYGNSTNTNGGDPQELSGTVTNNGTFSATLGTGSLGSSFTGTLNGNTGSGNWVNTNAGESGEWIGSRQ